PSLPSRGARGGRAGSSPSSVPPSLRGDFGHPARLVSGPRYIGFRSRIEGAGGRRVPTPSWIPPWNAVIRRSRFEAKKGRGRRLLRAPRLRSQVQGGTQGNGDDRQLRREDRRGREVHPGRQVDKRLRRNCRVVHDRLPRGIHERRAEPEPEEVRSIVGEREAPTALD